MKALLIAAALAASLAGFSQGAAKAAPPAAVSIEFTVTEFTPTTFGGVWQGAGALNDSGSFVRTGVNFTGSLANSPVVGTFQSVLVLSSSRGTLTLREQLMFTLTDVIGGWEITSGTGAYDHVTGHGTFEFASPIHFFDVGVISKVS
jgi:hypothetical protein